ncbi:hypothetical protein HNP40_003926 [Mycobacteroides chelonae]|nr:hypothetical protein [Mycobacteroides chelonae]
MAVAEGFEPYSATLGTSQNQLYLLKYIPVVHTSYL